MFFIFYSYRYTELCQSTVCEVKDAVDLLVRLIHSLELYCQLAVNLKWP